jgi:hypothetical protein
MDGMAKRLFVGTIVLLAYVTGLVQHGLAQRSGASAVVPPVLPSFPRMELGTAFAEPLSDCPGISGLLHSNERGIWILFADLKNTTGDGRRNESETTFTHRIRHGSCQYEITFGRQELQGSTWIDSKLRVPESSRGR